MDVCTIEHSSGNIIDFPIVNDLACLLWIVNLGCIDLNQWYAKCDDVNRPDYLHFDLDPVPDATLRSGARNGPDGTRCARRNSACAHIRKPRARKASIFMCRSFAVRCKSRCGALRNISPQALAKQYPALITAEYRVAKRPADRVLVDYNQNAWGRTLASVYSVRPKPRATVSTPVTWDEIERGVRIEDFRIDNVPARVRERAISLSRFFNSAGDSNSSQSYEPAHTVRLSADGSQERSANSRRSRLAI